MQLEERNLYLLWKDQGLSDDPHITFKEMFPQLHSFAKNEDVSVRKVADIAETDILDLFHSPLSDIAMQQCNELDVLLHNHFQNNEADS